MGKMKEIEVISVGNEGFEPYAGQGDVGTLQVRTFEEFINSPWIERNEADNDQLEMNDVLSQLKLKEI